MLRPSANVEIGASYDLDLLVDPPRAGRVAEILIACGARHGAALWDRGRAGALEDFHFHARDAEGAHLFFGVDVHTAETCLGVPFLTAERVLSRAVVHDGIRRPDPPQSACIDAFGHFLAGGLIPARHLERLRALVRSDPDSVERELSHWFGRRSARRVVRILAHEPNSVAKLGLASLRRSILARAFVRSPFAASATALEFAASMTVGPWFRPRGRMFVFLGTDGAGKSSLIEAICAVLRGSIGESRLARFRLRPGLLPRLGELVGAHSTESPSSSSESSPHRAKPSGSFGSAIRALYYAIDWTVGYALRILPRRRRSIVVLFDRYVDDYLVDPLRSRIRRGAPLLRSICRIAPRPERTIVCTASFATVRARKQELDADETERQLAAYEELARSRRATLVIDTETSLEESVDAALDFLFDAQEVR